MCYQMFSKEKVNTLSSMCVRVAMISGGGAPEIEMSLQQAEYAKILTGMQSLKLFAMAKN